MTALLCAHSLLFYNYLSPFRCCYFYLFLSPFPASRDALADCMEDSINFYLLKCQFGERHVQKQPYIFVATIQSKKSKSISETKNFISIVDGYSHFLLFYLSILFFFLIHKPWDQVQKILKNVHIQYRTTYFKRQRFFSLYKEHQNQHIFQWRMGQPQSI